MEEPTLIDLGPEARPNVDDRIEAFVVRYRSLLKKSGDSIIEQAKTIFEVETELGSKHQATFFRQIGLDPDGATVRKLKLIGEQSTRFTPYLHRIPNTWTTLYDLAKLDNDSFKRLTDADFITPFVTAKQIREFLNDKPQETSEAPKRAPRKATLDLAAASDGKQLYVALQEVANRFGVKLLADSKTKKQFAPPGTLEGII